MVLNQTSRILDQNQIAQKIKRIAYQIYERNFTEQEVLLAGIHQNGYALAERIAQQLSDISPLQVSLIRVVLDKETPLEQPVQLQPEQINVSGKVIILVDDVLNTGKTLAYSLIPFLQASPKKIETATLIDRHHTLYPVSVTYTGYSLSTTLQEHVKVVLDGETEAGAYLV